jgi:DNA (cytosine-5)-methyltransferase 1
MKKNKLTFIDLFAGIGGFHLALGKAGMECVAACEIDKKARNTYEANFRKISPGIWDKNQFWFDIKDITMTKSAVLPKYDILTGGFPCQPFSQAGKMTGINHHDGTLFDEIRKILEDTGPNAYILENVPNLMNISNKQVFKQIAQKIHLLKYSFWFEKLSALDFGLPTNRTRLYMVGFKNDPNNKITFDFSQLKKHKTPKLSEFFGYKWAPDYVKTFRTGGFDSPVGDRHNWTHYEIEKKMREITKDEAKKIMGFPDDFIFPKEKGISDRIALKQIGNSVAVNVVYEIGKEVKKTLNKYYTNG